MVRRKVDHSLSSEIAGGEREGERKRRNNKAG